MSASDEANTVRNLVLAVEYMRFACEHAESVSDAEMDRLGIAMSVGIVAGEAARNLVTDYQRPTFWEAVRELPQRLGIPERRAEAAARRRAIVAEAALGQEIKAQPQRVMLDLETFGTRPGACIVSLGAVRFGEGKILDRYYARIDPMDAQARGLVIDAATVVWWMQQSAEARVEIAAGGGKLLADVLGEFTAWIGEGETEVWGNGASFDNVLLDEAFRACGLKRPWPFWMDRCYRTVKELHPDVKLVRKGTHHNALDDAESQALHLMAMGVGA